MFESYSIIIYKTDVYTITVVIVNFSCNALVMHFPINRFLVYMKLHYTMSAEKAKDTSMRPRNKNLLNYNQG